MKDYYTQQEAAKLLQVSKHTVYSYAKQKKIQKIEDPYRLYREVRYKKEEIDAIIEERKKYPKGMKPSELAKSIGIDVQLIYKYINDGILRAHEVPFGDERTSYIITEEDQKKFIQFLKSNTNKSIRKTEYYLKEFNVALYQLFYSEDNPSLTARVFKNENNQWGFNIPQLLKHVPLTEGFEKYHFIAKYPLHDTQFGSKPYIYLKIPKSEDLLFTFIDQIYTLWGIKNAMLRDLDTHVHIAIKEYVIREWTEDFPFERFNQYLTTEGFITQNQNSLIVEKAVHKTSMELPTDLVTEIKKAAAEDKLNMNEWITQALRKQLVIRKEQ